MKKYPVTADFIDRLTGKYFVKGAVFETDDDDRAEELQVGKFIGEATTKVTRKANATQKGDGNES